MGDARTGVPDVSVFGLGAAISEEERTSLRKNELRNLLDSYADEADVFTEIIQNAMDSVQTAIEEGRYRDETPSLVVIVGRRSRDTHYFCVIDNGLGMDPQLAALFTMPGMSRRKQQGQTLGHKGVGASFFVAASEKFALHTLGEKGEITRLTVSGAYSWVRNQTSPTPVVAATADLPQAVQERLPKTRHTAACYYLHSNLKPKSLSHLVEVDPGNPSKEIGNWAGLLCAKTGLGQVSAAAHKIKVAFVLDVGDGRVTEEAWEFGTFDKQRRQLGYPYPHSVLRVDKDIREIDGAGAPAQLRMRQTLQAVRLRWSKDHILQSLEPRIDFSTEEREVVEEYLEFVDLYFAYSTTVMDDIRRRLGAHSNPVRYGIRLAVDGVPQGRMLGFSLTSDQGLDRQLHALISFRGLTLDTGRKIPANEHVAEVVRKLGTRAATHIKDYRIYMRRAERREPSHNLQEWRSEISAQRAGSLVGKLFLRLGLQPPIQVDPQNEADTIALFCGLASAGLLKGLRLASLSGYNAYDGLMDINENEPDNREQDDPLALCSPVGRGGELRVVEFKHIFESVIEDFESRRKVATDIDVLVCWNVSREVRRGSIEHWYGDRDLREVYAATHVWRDDNNVTDIVVLSLKHIVALLLQREELKAGTKGIGVATVATLLEVDTLASI